MPDRIILDFVKAINNHNVEDLISLISEDHVLRDSLGDSVKGIKDLEKAWKGYFTLFPDYQVKVRDLAINQDLILFSGWASGSVKQKDKRIHWKIPAAWKAKVKDGKVTYWQVFADHGEIKELLANTATES